MVLIPARRAPVEFGMVFPAGAFAAGGFEPVRDFDASSNGRFVQSKDKATGLPLWVVEVIDADKEARARTVKVKVAAQVQPVLPNGPAGVPFVPVEFAGLTVTPYVTQAGKLGYSLKASGVRSPSPGGRPAGRPGPDGGRESAA
ncbi:MAG: plasmid replication, integration and excision activator [Streptosporangiaceae bacterium]|nr:plasmid replication, integration and excision activator [Streptosporangiaceae bacterium]